MGRARLAGGSAGAVAGALGGSYRTRLAAAGELFDAGQDPRQGRAPRERPGQDGPGRELGADGMALFRMTVGRRNNADPRWLVPIICRRGHVTKKDIGLIRIFDRETQFEIAPHAAAHFAAAVRRTGDDEDIRIEPTGKLPGTAQGKRFQRHQPPARKGKLRAGKPAGREGTSARGEKAPGQRPGRKRDRT